MVPLCIIVFIAKRDHLLLSLSLIHILSIMEATELPVDRELEFFNALTLTETQQLIAAHILKEIRARLAFCSPWASAT